MAKPHRWFVSSAAERTRGGSLSAGVVVVVARASSPQNTDQWHGEVIQPTGVWGLYRTEQLGPTSTTEKDGDVSLR
jgi:hypothetical protein